MIKLNKLVTRNIQGIVERHQKLEVTCSWAGKENDRERQQYEQKRREKTNQIREMKTKKDEIRTNK